MWVIAYKLRKLVYNVVKAQEVVQHTVCAGRDAVTADRQACALGLPAGHSLTPRTLNAHLELNLN